jgi:hypothetical protein
VPAGPDWTEIEGVLTPVFRPSLRFQAPLS